MIIKTIPMITKNHYDTHNDNDHNKHVLIIFSVGDKTNNNDVICLLIIALNILCLTLTMYSCLFVINEEFFL